VPQPAAGLVAPDGRQRPSRDASRRRIGALGSTATWLLAASLLAVAVLGIFLSAQAARYLAEAPSAGPDRVFARAALHRALPPGNRVALDDSKPAEARSAGSPPAPRTVSAHSAPSSETSSPVRGALAAESPETAWQLLDFAPAAPEEGSRAPALSSAARSWQGETAPLHEHPAAHARTRAKTHGPKRHSSNNNQALTVPAGLPPLNAKVLKFGLEHRGQKVGDGICHTLVDQALAFAGARGVSDGSDGLVSYGRLLRAGEKVLPGDIILFWETMFPNEFMDYHVAIVARVNGTQITDLEQNWDGGNADGQIVKATDLDLAAERGGKIDIFRPEGQQGMAAAPTPARPLSRPLSPSNPGPVRVAPVPPPVAVRPPQVPPFAGPFRAPGYSPWARGPAWFRGRP
jgi:hypothetical protein